MDLTREEARELFPSNRGQSVDDVDVDPWVHVERNGFGWTVTIDQEEWFISGSDEEEALEWLESIGLDDPTMWGLIYAKTATEMLLEDVADRNT